MNSTTNPVKHGRYLALVYEWVGLPKDKPKEPEWVIKHFTGYWPKQKYYFDTGNYENLEVVAWMELPGIIHHC